MIKSRFNEAVETIIPKPEKEVERLLTAILPGSKFKGLVHAVGGYVRDQYMGVNAKDLDVVIEMKDGAKLFTEYVHNMFPAQTTTPYNLGAYPIWQITFKDDVALRGDVFRTKGAVIEFADTMKESFPDEESRQRETQYGTLDDDIKRRDFTVNMLMKDLTTGEFKDLSGTSKADIEKGILRGHPAVSLDKIFSDDPLRMIRLVRFQAKYGWKVPYSVIKTVKRNSERIKIVSAERIMSELTKIMQMGKLAQAIKFMDITGLLVHIFPEVSALHGVTQPKIHHAEGDCWKHTLLVLKNAPNTIEGQLAALLHDIAKPVTREENDGKIGFPKHDEVGAEMTDVILHRLKFDSGIIEQVKAMVRNHMRAHSLGDAGNKAMRKFLREVGNEMAIKILDLAEADALGSFPNTNDIPKARQKMEDVKNSPIQVSRKPILNGLEIMNVLKIKPGTKVGEAGKFLIELEDDLAENNIALTKEMAIEKLLEKFA